MVVTQFWSYANDVYNNESGKRLFPLVALGGNLGAFTGAGIADALLVYLNEFELLLVAAAMLVACIGITNMISRRIWGRSGMQQQQETLSPETAANPGHGLTQRGPGFWTTETTPLRCSDRRRRPDAEPGEHDWRIYSRQARRSAGPT